MFYQVRIKLGLAMDQNLALFLGVVLNSLNQLQEYGINLLYMYSAMGIILD